jgi:hypothetical protein
MGKAPKVPETQTVINKTELPAWVDAAGQDLLSRTQEASANMPGPYMGNIVPGFNDQITGAWNMAQAASTMGLPGMYAAQGGAMNAAYYNPQQVQAGTFPGGNLDAYMNPFLQNVEQQALSRLDDQRQMSLNRTGDQAIAANAFGGSRQGVMEGVTNAEAARAAGDISAGIRSAGFQQAQQAMQADQNRQLQAGMANQQAGLSGAQINNQGALGLANISQALQGMGLQGASIQEAIGQQLREYEGQLLAQQAMQYEMQRQAPFEGISKELQALGMVPYGQSSSTTGPNPAYYQQQQANPFMGALGGLSSGLSLAGTLGMTGGALGTGFSAGGLGLGGLGALLGIVSDEREKTDIKRLGKDGETGLDLYAYRYKGDPKSYPKAVGPMAQDIERKFPGAVREVGGKKVVSNLGFGPMRRSA